MKTLAELKQMSFIPHHDCGLCGAMVGWEALPNSPRPYFNPSCGCGSSGGHYDTWEEVFKWYNTVFEKESEDAVQLAWQKESSCENTIDQLAIKSANEICHCDKCSGEFSDTHLKCGPKPSNTCIGWNMGYRTAKLALEMYVKAKEEK